MKGILVYQSTHCSDLWVQTLILISAETVSIKLDKSNTVVFRTNWDQMDEEISVYFNDS